MIIPYATSAFIRFKRPKNMTTSPAVLKKTPDCAFEWITSDPKLKSARMGSVPSAKDDMVSAPVQKLPLESEYSCMDCVNPHGRKNVATPTRAGVRL